MESHSHSARLLLHRSWGRSSWAVRELLVKVEEADEWRWVTAASSSVAGSEVKAARLWCRNLILVCRQASRHVPGSVGVTGDCCARPCLVSAGARYTW